MLWSIIESENMMMFLTTTLAIPYSNKSLICIMGFFCQKSMSQTSHFEHASASIQTLISTTGVSCSGLQG